MPTLLTSLKDKTVHIARLTTTSGFKMLATTVTHAEMHIQPLSRERTELIEGVYGKTYVFYCDSSVDIKQGDKLRDEDDNYYKVIDGGVSKRDFGNFEHDEIIVEKLD